MAFRNNVHHSVNIILDSDPAKVKIEIGGEIQGWNSPDIRQRIMESQLILQNTFSRIVTAWHRDGIFTENFPFLLPTFSGGSYLYHIQK